MSIKKINQFPEGSGSLSSDDVFLFMDDPSGSGITKKISLSEISSTAYIYPKAYGSFYDTTTQTNASTSGSNIITINTTNVSDRISIVDNSKLTVYTSGIFNMQFSTQLEKIDGGDDSIDIWLSKNGEDLDWSNTRISMHAQDAKAAAAWNFMLPLNSGDYIQLKWYSSDADMRILSESGLINPTRPNIPSVILTANQI